VRCTVSKALKKISGRLPHFNSLMQQAVGGEKKYKIFFGNSEEKKSLEALDVDNYTM